ncbi:MAG: hypothetical protein ACLFT4_08860, partial [Bacteroidales bacterium]
GQGANMALPIWALYMEKIYEDEKLESLVSPEDKFEKPEGFNYELDCQEFEDDSDLKREEDDDFF